MATIAAVEHRVNDLQEALLELARQNERTARSVELLAVQTDRTALGLDRLSDEMREFKDEMREFKGGMLEFKNEMRGFKNEMLEFKNEMRGFKNEMLEFKNEMSGFKNEMLEFKDEMREFKNETSKANADLRYSLNKQNAELSDALGMLAENIVGPSIPTLFKRFFPGGEPEFAMRMLRRHRVSGERREFDTPAWNEGVFLLSETKSKLRPGDLDLLAEAIADVRNFFPEAQGKRVCGALASLYIDPSLVIAGERRGFIMIALGNNLAEVMNSEGFKPTEF